MFVPRMEEFQFSVYLFPPPKFFPGQMCQGSIESLECKIADLFTAIAC